MTTLVDALGNIVALLALSAIPAILVGRQRRPGALSFLKLHAAVFTAVMGLAVVAFVARAATDPWWPHPMLVPFLFLAALVWAMELLALPAIIKGARLRGEGTGRRFLFTGTLVALALGLCAGVLIWSEVMHRRIIEAAEATAGDSPYCLLARHRPSRDRSEYVAWSRDVPGRGELAFAFSVVLVVERSDGRAYFAGPGRSSFFLLQPRNVFATSHAAIDAACVPRPHAGRDWR